GGVAEFEVAERPLQAQPGVGEGAQVGDPGGDGAAQLLGVGAARVVVRRGVDGDGAQRAVRAPPGEVRGDGEVGRAAGAGRQAERVGAQVPLGRSGGEQDAGRLAGLRPGVEHDGRDGEVDPGEHGGQLGDGDAALPGDQPDRGDAAGEVGGDGGGVGDGVTLPYL